MNHLNPDESPDCDADIDQFEQQLRAIRPAPPTCDFNSIADALAVSLEHAATTANVPANTSIWRPIISHAVTATIGLAIGVGVMLLMQTPSVPISAGSSETASNLIELVEPVDNPSPAEDSQNVWTPETLATANQSQANYLQPEPTWGFHQRPLRAFGSLDARLASVRDWQPHDGRQEFKQSKDDDTSDIEYDDLPTDKPPLSPRSLHLFLNDLTFSPTSNNPFCSAEEFSS